MLYLKDEFNYSFGFSAIYRSDDERSYPFGAEGADFQGWKKQSEWRIFETDRFTCDLLGKCRQKDVIVSISLLISLFWFLRYHHRATCCLKSRIKYSLYTRLSLKQSSHRKVWWSFEILSRSQILKIYLQMRTRHILAISAMFSTSDVSSVRSFFYNLSAKSYVLSISWN